MFRGSTSKHGAAHSETLTQPPTLDTIPDMPITRSAKKALRQSLTRRGRHLQKKEAYKTLAKEIKKLAASDGGKANARALLPKLYQALDKAAKAHSIKKNKASRLKSRLTKRVKDV